jgi:hypothetical protein
MHSYRMSDCLSPEGINIIEPYIPPPPLAFAGIIRSSDNLKFADTGMIQPSESYGDSVSSSVNGGDKLSNTNRQK